MSLLRHHLLKSPFIVHPKSCSEEGRFSGVGRFCCPIDPDKVGEFDPFSVPYLDEVFENEESRGMNWRRLMRSEEVQRVCSAVQGQVPSGFAQGVCH